MALDSNVLRDEIATQIANKGLAVIDTETLDAIAIAIVNHIKNSAVTTTAVTGGSSSGTYTGTIS
jgi:hypothetical protein